MWVEQAAKKEVFLHKERFSTESFTIVFTRMKRGWLIALQIANIKEKYSKY